MKYPRPIHPNYAALVLTTLLLGTIPTCRAAETLPSRAVDSLLHAAQRAKSVVATSQDRVIKSLQAVGDLVSQFEPRDLDGLNTEAELISEYRKKLIPALKQSGEELQSQYAQFVNDLEKYQLSLPEAAKSFRELAAQYEGYAETEDDTFFRKEYKDMSRRAVVFAEAMEQRLTTVEQWREQADIKQQFVQRSLVYLSRLDDFLSIVPSPDKTTEIRAYVERVNKYIEHVQQAIEGVREYTRKLETSLSDENPTSGDKDADSPKTTPAPQTGVQHAPDTPTKPARQPPSRESLNELENRLQNLNVPTNDKVASTWDYAIPHRSR